MGAKNKSLALILVALFLPSIVVLPPATVKAQPKTIVVPTDYPTISLAINAAENGTIIFSGMEHMKNKPSQ